MKILITLYCLFFAASAISQQYELVISDVHVITMKSDSVIPLQNIYISGNTIKLIEPAALGRRKTRLRIDGKGRYAMPGLYDMHVHFPSIDAARFFSLQQAAGITACRIMKSTPEAFVLTKKDSLHLLPHFYTAYNFYSSDTTHIKQLPELIASLKNAGYALIKIFSIQSVDYFDAMMAASKANGLPVCGHALTNLSPQHVLQSGYRSIEHVGYFDKAKTPEALDSLIELAVKNKTFICPTLDWSLMVYHSTPQDSLPYRAGYTIGKKLYGQQWDSTYIATSAQIAKPEAREYPDLMRNSVAKKIDILKKMRMKGLQIIAGSDAEEPYQTPGFSLIDELKLIQKAGYNNYELLKMVTVNAALFFNEKNRKATLSRGQPADIILLSQNPLADISNLETVELVVRGNATITNTLALLRELK